MALMALVCAAATRYHRAMRPPAIVVLGALTVAAPGALGACAASNQAVETARAAHYRGDPLAMFAAAKSAVEAKYELAMSDETRLRIETTARFYAPDGLGIPARDINDVPDRGIQMKLIVRLVQAGDARDDWAVAVEPVMMRYFVGRPDPDRLTLDDPSVPGWARGRVDQLYAAVHEALQRYAIAPAERPPASATSLLPKEPAATAPAHEPDPPAQREP